MIMCKHKLVSSSTETDLEKKLEPLGPAGWHAMNFTAVHIPQPSGNAGRGSGRIVRAS